MKKITIRLFQTDQNQNFLNLEKTKKIKPIDSIGLSRELPEYDIYLTASLEEAGANHVLEAMAAGLPIIYHKDGGSIPEYCKDYGLEFSSYEDLNKKIDIMIRDFEKYKKAVMNYNQKIENTIKEYEKIICEL